MQTIKITPKRYSYRNIFLERNLFSTILTVGYNNVAYYAEYM